MNLPDPLPIRPWRKGCCGSVRLPGSKSLTNRALILAALSGGTLSLTHALFSRDSTLLVRALQDLGFEVSADPEKAAIRIKGEGGSIPASTGELFVGNAGTAARFLTALVCLHPQGRYRFDGDTEMRRRPMEGLIRALGGIGARFTFHGEKGFFPFTVETGGLRGNKWTVDARASSQMLSALLMVAPFAGKPVRIEHGPVRPAFVRMTALMMEQFGARVRGSTDDFHEVHPLPAYAPPAPAYAIEPDATAASYFLALPLVVGGGLTIKGLRRGMLQGDLAFAGVLHELGLSVTEADDGWELSTHPPNGTKARTFSFETFSDTFLTLAAVAPLLPFPVTLTGIRHTRHQECDRIEAVTTELKRVGFHAEAGEDFVRVHPVPPGWRPPARPVTLETHRDHRVAMAFAILGCRDMRGDGRPWLSLADPSCADKTFPGFFSVLHGMYLESHDKKRSQ